MLRSSTVYRRLWYVKRRHAKRLNLYIRFIAIIIIFVLTASYAEKRLMPRFLEIAEFKVNGVIAAAMKDAVDKWFPDDMKDTDFVTVNRDGDGRITSIRTDVARLNRLSAGISADIREQLSRVKKEDIAVPFGTLLGNSLLAGMGPDLHIKIAPVENVGAEFISEFSDAGINQTRHRIVLKVQVRVDIAAPLMEKQSEFDTELPVAETVIVGNVPEAYLNIN